MWSSIPLKVKLQRYQIHKNDPKGQKEYQKERLEQIIVFIHLALVALSLNVQLANRKACTM